MSVSYGGDSIVFADGSVNSSGFIGHRNRIINGAMMVDQRNTGAAVTVNSISVSPYITDRFYCNGVTSDGVFTAQQTTTAPAGFTNSLKFTVTTADASIGATQRYEFAQVIEGFNFADFNFGSANAKTFTLSFWIRASVTGTYGGAFVNEAANRSYVFSYTISAADTWEYKTITVAGDTTGTWTGATNGYGLRVYWSLGEGSTYQTTAGSWTSGFYLAPTGQTNLIATLNATMYITGVQLERGSTASSFEYRSYGAELQLCQRYCFTLISNASNASTFVGGWRPATGAVQTSIPFPVVMRATPTCSIPAGNSSWSVEDGLNPYTGTPSIINPNSYNTTLSIPIASPPSFASGYAPMIHMFAASGGVCLLASAEL